MHKNIAKIIDQIVKESPYNNIKCEVIPNNTGGFWRLILTLENRHHAHAEALVRALHHIGTIYGESLDIQDEGKIVRIQ